MATDTICYSNDLQTVRFVSGLLLYVQGGFKKVPPKVKKPAAKKSSSAIAAAAAAEAKARASKKGNKKDKSTFNQVSRSSTSLPGLCVCCCRLASVLDEVPCSFWCASSGLQLSFHVMCRPPHDSADPATPIQHGADQPMFPRLSYAATAGLLHFLNKLASIILPVVSLPASPLETCACTSG